MIKVDGLELIYHRKTPFQTEALKKVSFSIGEGEIIGLIGPSGSGKSSLLRCMAGVLEPTGGRVFRNRDLLQDHIPEIGLVIQEPEQQFFLDTVFEEVALGLAQWGLSGEEVTRRVKEACMQLGFNGDLQSSPFHLSGGQQRRVAFAAILIMAPRVLLLDEPTVGLDAAGIGMIAKIISDYKSRRRSVVIISHDLDFLYENVSRFLVMNQGCVIADFYKPQFMEYAWCLTEFGLDLPEAVRLLQRKIPEWLRAELQKW